MMTLPRRLLLMRSPSIDTRARLVGVMKLFLMGDVCLCLV